MLSLTPTTTTLQSQRGSRSKHAEQEVSSSWAGAEDLKKVEEELDASMDPSSGSSRWKTSSSSSSSQAQGQYEDAGQKAAALAQMSQTGSWRRGMTAQVGITPPRTKGSSAALKTPGSSYSTWSTVELKYSRTQCEEWLIGLPQNVTVFDWYKMHQWKAVDTLKVEKRVKKGTNMQKSTSIYFCIMIQVH